MAIASALALELEHEVCKCAAGAVQALSQGGAALPAGRVGVGGWELFAPAGKKNFEQPKKPSLDAFEGLSSCSSNAH